VQGVYVGHQGGRVLLEHGQTVRPQPFGQVGGLGVWPEPPEEERRLAGLEPGDGVVDGGVCIGGGEAGIEGAFEDGAARRGVVAAEARRLVQVAAEGLVH